MARVSARRGVRHGARCRATNPPDGPTGPAGRRPRTGQVRAGRGRDRKRDRTSSDRPHGLAHEIDGGSIARRARSLTVSYAHSPSVAVRPPRETAEAADARRERRDGPAGCQRAIRQITRPNGLRDNAKRGARWLIAKGMTRRGFSIPVGHRKTNLCHAGDEIQFHLVNVGRGVFSRANAVELGQVVLGQDQPGTVDVLTQMRDGRGAGDEQDVRRTP